MVGSQIQAVSVAASQYSSREAQERLIVDRVTHLDNLADKLREERVRRVVEPILTGAAETACSDEDGEWRVSSERFLNGTPCSGCRMRSGQPTAWW